MATKAKARVGVAAKRTTPAQPRLDTTVVKAFAVLELLANSDTPLGVSAIGQSLDLQKSNVHRLLQTLHELGYVQKHSDSSRYSLTLKPWEMGMRVMGRSALRRAAVPFMRALNQECQEAVYLAILSGMEILYLDRIDAPYPLRPTVRPGARVPAVFPASGKLLLAYQPDAEALVRRIVATFPSAASLDVGVFMQELETIRQRGYATSVSGWQPRVNSVAAIIPNNASPPIAAVGISGPSERLPQDKLDALAPAALNAAAHIAETLGSVDDEI
jgi:DNA-binding IclR family transcriptional regulator